jgi:hypothetical protein
VSYPGYAVEIAEDYRLYFFYSEGPKGIIKKAVIYSSLGNGLYNLSFGDWNEKLNKIDDSIRTNNGDRGKVPATVAFTALDFTDKFLKASLFMEGSTPSRTRLYQIGIGNNLSEINKHFDIYGYRLQRWEPFTHARNYDAFLADRK